MSPHDGGRRAVPVDRPDPSPVQPGEILLEAREITVRVRDRHLLAGTDWRIRAGEQWGVMGPNGSGKSSLVRALAGLAPTSSGTVLRNLPGGAAAIGYVSFEAHEEVLRRESDLERGRAFSCRPDPQSLARSLLPADAPAGRFAPPHLLDRPLAALSTGELRRLLLARALAARPALLILDEPFDGLDAGSREALRETLSGLARGGLPLILVTHRADELLPETTHLLRVRDGRVVFRGPCPGAMVRLDPASPPAAAAAARASGPAPSAVPAAASPSPPGEPLVELRDVTVRYGGTVVLDRLTWTVRRGERWAVLGPNGSGKTTLLELICGDHPQVYSNDVRLFGRRRAAEDGEPGGASEVGASEGGGLIDLWEVRRRIGAVSQRLQAAYLPAAPLTCREVILSGFFASVGLFRRPDAAQHAAAGEWIRRLGLEPLAERPYARLSYGERRRVLIARALVKSPELLVLDEPCEGLDESSRAAVLELVERAAGRHGSGSQDGLSLLFVTHRLEELPRCLTHVLRLQAGRRVREAHDFGE